MPSITENILNNISSLRADYKRVIADPVAQLESAVTKLRDGGLVAYAFTPLNPQLTNKSLVAIDGGRISKQLSGGDLIIAGATVADGLYPVKVFGEDSISETVATIIQHSEKSDRFAQAIMAACELKVLTHSAEADYRIIDGRLLGNVSEVLFALMSEHADGISKVLEINSDGSVFDAIRQLSTPVDSVNIFAVPKSDSSYEQSKELISSVIEDREVAKSLASRISDRKLASKLLHPGEFMIPKHGRTNPTFIHEYENHTKQFPRVTRGILEDSWNSFSAIQEGRATGQLYSTYFKPTLWPQDSKALKVEFYVLDGVSPLERAREVVQIIDADTVDYSIMEPYSQYLVDLLAKDVSKTVDTIQSVLADEATKADLNDIVRSYRT